MLTDRNVVMIGLMMALAPLASCGGQDAGRSALMKQAAVDAAAVHAHDPCTLLSADEAEPYIGPLVSPPYRSSDGAADTLGDECMYRGRDGRELTVLPDWSGGGVTAISSVQGAADALGAALARSGGVGLDTMAHRVVKAETTGPWDKATWIPGGSLLAAQGPLTVQVDVSGASGKEADAVALATIIMPRFAQPLRYDGTAAVALAPKPRPHPAKACDLLPRGAVEAAIGPVDGSPTSDTPETSCVWRVATPEGERSYAVEFGWEGGAKNYQMLKHNMAMVSGVMGLPSSSPLDTMKPPPQMQAAIGGLMKMMGRGSKDGVKGAAPGPAATIGFQTDTTLQGPWDNAALLHGTQLIAVRHDVFVGMDLQSADYAKAKLLLAAITERL